MTEAAPSLLRLMREAGRVRAKERQHNAVCGECLDLPGSRAAVRGILAGMNVRVSEKEERECAVAFGLGLRQELRRRSQALEKSSPIRH